MTLQFDERTHTYRLAGQRLPSVTQILQPLVDLSRIPRDVLEAKRDLGRRVHLACQLDDEHDLLESSVEEDVRPRLEAWRRFLRETGAEVLANEQRVYHPTLHYAGTLDNVLRIGRDEWLIDKKTSIATPISTGPQTAAYSQASSSAGLPPLRRGALLLHDDGRYQLDPLTGADDWACFVACLTLYRFKENHQ
jgi:hypothetical protein